MPAALLAAPPSTPVSFGGAPMYLPVTPSTPGSASLEDIAVDANGTVYILDTGNRNVIVETQDYLGRQLTSDTGPAGYPSSVPTIINCIGLASGGPGGHGLWNPTAITITGNGTMYIADTNNSRVVSVNLTTNACSVVGMGTGSTVTLVQPSGVAVSEYGDLYISDTLAGPGGNGMIVRIPYGGIAYDMMDESTTIAGNTYSCPLGPASCSYFWEGLPAVVNGIWNPKHIAWDAYDDILFIADTGNSRILAAAEQWIYGNGGTLPYEIETSGAWNWPQNFTGDNSQQPNGIAVDSVGNLYWTDLTSINVFELPHNGVPSPVSTNWNTTNYALNNQNLGGMNLTIAPGNHSPFSSATSIYVDQWGTVYVVDNGNGNIVVDLGKINGQSVATTGYVGAVNFYHVPLNSTSYEWQELVFNIPSGTTVAAATAYTEGTEFLDFNLNNTLGSERGCYDGFTGPGTCYLLVSFKPTAPGLRRGAVVLYDASGSQLANAPLFGVGTAPEAEFFPAGYGAAISTGGLATVQPMQIALDGDNNLYVANYTGDSVIEVPPQGGTSEILASQTGGTATYPEQAAGVAIDGAGDVFIADHQGSQIWVTNPNDPYIGFSAMQIDMDPGVLPISEPMEINFDPAGNLYIADWGNSRVVEVSGIFINNSRIFEGRGSVIQTTGTYLGLGYALPASGSLNPTGGKTVTGVAVDPLMNVYITDSVPGTILAAPQSLNQIATGFAAPGRLNWPNAFGTLPGVTGAFNLPQGLTTDGMGNLYVADAGNKRIIAGNPQTELGTTFGAPRSATNVGVTVTSNTAMPGPLGSNLFGVTVDPWGNVFVPDYANNRIAAYYPTTPPTENFGSLPVGIASATQTAKLWNIGNENLVIQPPTTGLNPSISANFTWNGASSCTQIGSTGSFSLVPGNACNIIDGFLPTVTGIISGNVVITDNNLYAAGSYGITGWPTQAIPLTGTGLLVTPASVVLTGTPNPVYVLDVVTYTATVTGTTGGGTPTGTVTFYDGLTTLGTATLNGSGVATLQAAPQAVIATTQYINGTHSITAVYNGSAIYTTLTSSTLPLVVQDFSFSVFNPSSAVVNPGGTAVFTVTVSPVNGSTFPAAIAFTVTGAPTGATVTLTPTTNSIASGASPTSVVMTVVAPNIVTSANRPPESLGRKLAPISFALLLLPLFGVRRMRRTWQRYLVLLIMLAGGFAATTALSGCSNSPSGYFGQGTTYDYTVTLTGTSGSLVHSSSVTLTVN
jgi:sugar lactone lactonase YvrE